LPLVEKTSADEAQIRARVGETLEMVGLNHDGKKYPAELSGGMRKRAGLARAIVGNPEIVLYDEPTSGLDPVAARMIDNLIMDLEKQLGVTSVVVTHDLQSALSIGSRIALLFDGRFIELSEPQEFLKSKHAQVQAFLAAQYITTPGIWEKSRICR